jgi:hypothetical protein
MKAMPTLYLSYAREDEKQVQELYDRLSAAGFKPWTVARDVQPGADWAALSMEAIRRSDFFLAILSGHTAGQSGFIAQELDAALDVKSRKPADEVYLIPVRLEECDVPERLGTILWIDLFKEDGWDRLLGALSATSPRLLRRPEPPDDLVQACLDGNCILDVGSGLSARAGFPTWKSLVSDLLEWAHQQDWIEPSSYRSLTKAIDAGEVNSAADGLVSELTRAGQEGELNAYLRQVFVEPAPELPDTHRILKQIPFAAALTSNYDQLLERTFAEVSPRVYSPGNVYELGEALRTREFFILKLNGLLEPPQDVLLAPAQYQDMIANNGRFADFMAGLFVSRTILFLGASLDGIFDFLESIKIRPSDRVHYALVAVAGSAWETRADALQRRYNIRVLPFPLSESFPEVLDFLEALARHVTEGRGDQAALGVQAPAEGHPPGWLKRIRLENVGPFEQLELELDASWNVLLGDNGVGKSSILRAIGLAMCGKDAQPYAERLIRSGQAGGRISLETSLGAQYVTELRRTRSEAEVASLPSRPLDVEGWLALGFPPLRSVGWQRPQGPQLPDPSTLGPNSADLLPLMSNDPDPRISALKQWIVNLDYRASKESTLTRKLLDDFFQVVDGLTPGLSLGFGQVDPKTYQITVITDDGPVPIEVISQGTQSLVGWTGILLERLYEVYSHVERPRDEYALVLIDEIDAHMHPAWQQTIVPALSQLFPRVQFIATTHSPLIVAEMEGEQVLVLSRDADTKELSARHPDEDFSALRADQILTSSLFGLDRSRGSKGVHGIERYAELLGKAEKTPQEEAEFQSLRDSLETSFLSGDTPLRRQIEQAIRDTFVQMNFETPVAAESLKRELPPDLELEIRRQLNELLGQGEEGA